MSQMAATILAAGLGQRLGGRPKATLQVDGVSVLERLVSALLGVGVQAVSVVMGPYRDQLLPLVVRSGAQALCHSLPTPSLVDSQRLALDEHHAQWPGHDLLLVLGDLPLLGSDDIAPLLAEWQRLPVSAHAHTTRALLPVVNGVRGHPVFLSAHAVEQAVAMPRHLGVRHWLAAHPEAVALIHTDRPAHISDLDTPHDLAALQTRLYPTPVAWPLP